MKVKFLRDSGEDKTGSVKEVDDAKGQYWIQMGLVESVDGKASKTISGATKEKNAKAGPNPAKKK